MPGNVLIGKKLGDYMIVEMLGQGGMAHVYKGYDANLDRYAAVKVILQNTVAGDDEKEYQQRFQNEARSIARLSHPRIVSVYQFGQAEDLMYYMAMKFVDGHDLRQILKEYIKRGKRMSTDYILQIIRHIADALDYAHIQGVIHRDVKPSNIMVTQDGHAVLTDFGLALNTNEGTLGNTFGSVHYIAPEQAVSSKQASPQSDLYSLGVVVYELLTGKVPFDDVSAMSVALKHISDPPPPPSNINPDISPLVEEVLMKMLDKDPRRRYLTGSAFVQALESAFSMNPDQDTEDLPASRSTPIPAFSSAELIKPVEPLVKPADAAIRATPAATPRPTLADIQNAETVTDSSRSSKMREDMLKAQSKMRSTLGAKERRRSAVLVGSVVLVLLLGGFALLWAMIGNTNAAIVLTTTPSQVAAVSTVTFEETAAEPPAGAVEGTEALQAVATVQPTRTFTRTVPPPSATPQPRDTATAMPVKDTPEPTLTPTVGLETSEGEAQLLLRYDGRTLMLYNRSAADQVDVSDLEFVRVATSGAEVRFNARQWGSGNDNLYALRPGDCFQVWSPDFSSLGVDEFPAEMCRYRQGFLQINDLFWVSSIEGAAFEVRRDDELLTTCPTVSEDNTDDNRCAIKLLVD